MGWVTVDRVEVRCLGRLAKHILCVEGPLIRHTEENAQM